MSAGLQGRSCGPHRSLVPRQRLQGEWGDEPFVKGTKKPHNARLLMWWAQQDSNLRPRDYESPALTN